ncbi:hypothetical protein ACFFKU_00835 [Kineococcus gynurae]|uniref:Uncharacterized protein n=1 Tax=Kineococcus gynurae TaxID=452979 RepID=A0ABV5LPV9_9ACTN
MPAPTEPQPTLLDEGGLVDPGVDGGADRDGERTPTATERSLRRALLLDERQAAALRRRHRGVGIRLPRTLPVPAAQESRRDS